MLGFIIFQGQRSIFGAETTVPGGPPMSNIPLCPHCGAESHGDAPGGPCLRCLQRPIINREILGTVGDGLTTIGGPGVAQDSAEAGAARTETRPPQKASVWTHQAETASLMSHEVLRDPGAAVHTSSIRSVAGDDMTLSYVALRTDGAIETRLRDFKYDPLANLTPGIELQDRYRLGAELGRGGMGIVFLGHDKRLDRPVAIKVILPSEHVQTKTKRARLEKMFAEESRLGANLMHHGIATVFDYAFQGPLPYTVFEYVPGESLRALLNRRRRLPLGEVLLFLGEIAGALDFAHGRKVVHQDLKPENIQVSEGSGAYP
jgi:hypothetical protein